MQGDQVEFIVGPEKKKYRLAETLLTDSSDVFAALIVAAKLKQRNNRADRVHGRNIKGEGSNNTAIGDSEGDKKLPIITLKDDPIAYFEILLEYMMNGKIGTEVVEVSSTLDAIKFMEYAVAYELPGACDAVYDGLKSYLRDSNRLITEAHIQSVFKASMPGSLIRPLIIQGAICHKGLRGMEDYSKLEITVDGYAQLLLVEMRTCLETLRYNNVYKDPLTNKNRTF